MVVVYPVIFTETETNTLIEVPDLKLYTEANEEGEARAPLSEAIAMARDIIGLTFAESSSRPQDPSCISRIVVADGVFATEGFSFVSLVDVDLTNYGIKDN